MRGGKSGRVGSNGVSRKGKDCLTADNPYTKINNQEGGKSKGQTQATQHRRRDNAEKEKKGVKERLGRTKGEKQDRSRRGTQQQICHNHKNCV